MCYSFIGFFLSFQFKSIMWPKISKRVLHFFVVFTLPMTKFGHAQISVPKIGIPMSTTACINPW